MTNRFQHPNPRRAAALAFLALFAAASVHAAMIAQWRFDDPARLPGGSHYGPDNYAPTHLNPNVTTAGLQRGAAVNPDGTGAAQHAWGGRGHAGNAVFKSMSAAEAAGFFLYFELFAGEGHTMSITGFNYTLHASATGPDSAQWQYSLDGENFVNIGEQLVMTASNDAGKEIEVTRSAHLDLSEFNLDDITSIIFRVVAWDATSAAGTFYLDGRNPEDGKYPPVLTIFGNVNPVPEPSVVLLLGAGVVLLGLRRRGKEHGFSTRANVKARPRIRTG